MFLFYNGRNLLSLFFVFVQYLEQSLPGKRSQYSDSLRAGWFWDRISVRVRFFAPVQTCPGAHPVSCRMGAVPFSRG
jgi:hypothetical protein